MELTFPQQLGGSFQTNDTNKLNRSLTGYLQQFFIDAHGSSPIHDSILLPKSYFGKYYPPHTL